MKSPLLVESSTETADGCPNLISRQVWNRLQELKKKITQELLNEGPLCQTGSDEVGDDQILSADDRLIEWHHRSQIEARLRDLTDAENRLLDGNYGVCSECGKQIQPARLAADPLVSLCVGCRSARETETVFPTL